MEIEIKRDKKDEKGKIRRQRKETGVTREITRIRKKESKGQQQVTNRKRKGR